MTDDWVDWWQRVESAVPQIWGRYTLWVHAKSVVLHQFFNGADKFVLEKGTIGNAVPHTPWRIRLPWGRAVELIAIAAEDDSFVNGTEVYVATCAGPVRNTWVACLNWPPPPPLCRMSTEEAMEVVRHVLGSDRVRPDAGE